MLSCIFTHIRVIQHIRRCWETGKCKAQCRRGYLLRKIHTDREPLQKDWMETQNKPEVCTWGKALRQYACVHAVRTQQSAASQKVLLCCWVMLSKPTEYPKAMRYNGKQDWRNLYDDCGKLKHQFPLLERSNLLFRENVIYSASASLSAYCVT